MPTTLEKVVKLTNASAFSRYNDCMKRRILLILTLIFFALTLALIVHTRQSRATVEAAAQESATLQAAAAAQRIDASFTQVMAIAHNIVADLESGAQPYDEIQARLRAEVDARPDIDGLAVTFEPFAYDPELRLYQHYIYRTNGAFDTLDGATYDYSQPPNDQPDSPRTAWYHDPLNNGALWNEPFTATGAGKVLIEYGIPFYRVDQPHTRENVAGVVTIDYSLQDMRDLTAALELGATGYGMVFSTSGTFLAHPVPDYVVNQSVFALAPELSDAASRALAGERLTFETVDTVTGESAWAFFEPLPSTEWGLGILLNKSEFMPNAQDNVRQSMLIALSASAFVLCLAAFLLSTPPRRPIAPVVVYSVFCAICLVLITLSWVLAAGLHGTRGTRMADIVSVERYLANYLHSLPNGNVTANDTTGTIIGEMITIPTGVLIQTVEFPTPTSARMNGYVWQSYPLDSEIEQGVIFQQRIGEEATFDEINRVVQGDREVVIWYFGIELKQNFNPSLFPFDNRAVTLRLAPVDLAHNVILTPDFTAYNLINPRLLPGLDVETRVNNWHIQETSYSYERSAFNADFGLRQRMNFPSPPELHFTINMSRAFLGSFIAYLLPGLVVALMLFAFLINERKQGDKDEITTTLNYAAALFFVVAISHSSLRDSVGAEGLTYMEYLYILLYVAIIVVAAETFLEVRLKELPKWLPIDRRAIIRMIHLLYFPVFLGTLLVVTLALFIP